MIPKGLCAYLGQGTGGVSHSIGVRGRFGIITRLYNLEDASHGFVAEHWRSLAVMRFGQSLVPAVDWHARHPEPRPQCKAAMCM